jgi:hypothetical protein
MEKLLQEVGKDILPGVSYIDNFAVKISQSFPVVITKILNV